MLTVYRPTTRSVPMRDVLTVKLTPEIKQLTAPRLQCCSVCPHPSSPCRCRVWGGAAGPRASLKAEASSGGSEPPIHFHVTESVSSAQHNSHARLGHTGECTFLPQTSSTHVLHRDLCVSRLTPISMFHHCQYTENTERTVVSGFSEDVGGVPAPPSPLFSPLGVHGPL